MGAKNIRGRPKLDELTRVERLVVRTRITAAAVDAELIQALCLSENSVRNEEVTQVAMARLALFEKLEHLNQKKSELRKAGLDIDNIQAARIKLMSEINNFPRLGFLADEWSSLSEEDRQDAPGRPVLQLELRVVRAKKAFTEAVKALRELEAKHGRKPCRLDQLNDPAADETRPGRRKTDFLGKLEWEERYLTRKLGELLRRKTLAGGDQDLYSGVQMGRKPLPIKDRIFATEKKLIELRALIAEQVSILPPLALIDRELRLLRNEASTVRKVIRMSNDATKQQLLKERLSRLETTIDELLNIRGEIGREFETTKNRDQKAELIKEAALSRIRQVTTRVWEGGNGRDQP